MLGAVRTPFRQRRYGQRNDSERTSDLMELGTPTREISVVERCVPDRCMLPSKVDRRWLVYRNGPADDVFVNMLQEIPKGAYACPNRVSEEFQVPWPWHQRGSILLRVTDAA